MSEINDNKRRTIRMTDLMWETLADLATYNHRTIGEEIRVACENWILSANYDFTEDRAKRTAAGSFRKVEAA